MLTNSCTHTYQLLSESGGKDSDQQWLAVTPLFRLVRKVFCGHELECVCICVVVEKKWRRKILQVVLKCLIVLLWLNTTTVVWIILHLNITSIYLLPFENVAFVQCADLYKCKSCFSDEKRGGSLTWSNGRLHKGEIKWVREDEHDNSGQIKYYTFYSSESHVLYFRTAFPLDIYWKTRECGQS